MAAVVLDQVTKWLAVEYLKPRYTVPLIQDALHLTYVENTGASFGMLKDHRWVFMVVSTVMIFGIIIFLLLQKKIPPVLGLSMGMILGGGIGNMIDRVLLGYVVDFIDFRLINFAVFNGADSFICVGAAILFIYVLMLETEEEKKKKAEKAAASENSASEDSESKQEKEENE